MTAESRRGRSVDMCNSIILLSLLALPGEPAAAGQPKVVSFRLDNGL